MDKREVSDNLNKFLGTNIKFDKLSKKELDELYDIFNDPKKILELLHNAMGMEDFANLLIEYSKEKAIKKAVDAKPVRKIIKGIFNL